MQDGNAARLEQLGLSAPEAQIYLAILHHGPLAAAAIAYETGIKRPSVYPILTSLADKGLVEGGAGYGSKFAAIAPDEALPALVWREKQTIAERESIAAELVETLAPLAADAESALHDTVQVLRTPQVITERLDRLQLEAKRDVEVIVKNPILNPRLRNPAQQKAQRRGVRFKCLYESAVIDDPKIKPYLAGWIAAGEQARVYDGELPYKLMVLDSQIVVLTLVKQSGQSLALLVRHAPLAKSMNLLFDSFWSAAEPLAPPLIKAKAARDRRRKLTSPVPLRDGRYNRRP
jgi:HTH-type transcriptional regulator, sugar sensing transcriptional regulator